MDLKVSGDKFSGEGGKCISQEDVESIYHEKMSQLELPCEAIGKKKGEKGRQNAALQKV